MNAASNGINPLTNNTSGGSDSADADSPPPSVVRSPLAPNQMTGSFLQCPTASGSSPSNANGGSSTSSSAISRRSTNQNSSNILSNGTSNASNNFLNSLPGLFSSGANQNPDDFSSAMSVMANYLAPPQAVDDSPNALFGRLVANELDKLPPGIHNVARAQILLLLAQSSQQTPNNANSAAADRILACLTP